MKKLLSVLLVLVMLSTGAVCAFAAAPKVNGCNWMSVIRDNTSLADISMPGTHDSAATYVAVGIKSRCQDKTIPEQLNCGARFLDIRLCEEKGKLKLVHNFITCHKGSGFDAPVLYFSDVVGYCLDFLSKNPKESIVLFIKEDFGDSKQFDDALAKQISENADAWYTENRVPSLGEARGKLVLMNRFAKETSKLTDSNGGINLSNFPVQITELEAYDVMPIMSFEGTMISSYTLQDRYKFNKDDKWSLAIVPTLDYEKPEGGILINFFSTAAGLSPEINARYINKQALQHKLDSRKCYGFVLFDFIDEDLAVKVYSCNAAVTDSSMNPTPPQAAEVPTPEHGFFRFFDSLWAFLINLFSQKQ